MKKIAIYGKGGIGKSTTVSNLSAALSREGLRVLQIGCDPKADSTKNLTAGEPLPGILELMRTVPGPLGLSDLVKTGFNGVFCVEAGGPMPGIGCAGRGIITALEKLEELGAYEELEPDIVLFDVLGDVVCGGFAMPMREGYADEVAIVTSGEMMALYAASNITRAIRTFEGRNYASLAGLILNRRNIENEDELVERAAREMEAPIIGDIPRSPLVQQAEDRGMTVVECFPDSPQSSRYREIALKLYAGIKEPLAL